jgi:hypothetical protein
VDGIANLAGAVPFLIALHCNARNGILRKVIWGRSRHRGWSVAQLERLWLLAFLVALGFTEIRKAAILDLRLRIEYREVTISCANLGWECSLRALSGFESNDRLRH